MCSNLMGSNLNVYVTNNPKYDRENPRVFMNGDNLFFVQFKTSSENRVPAVLLGDNTVIPKQESCSKAKCNFPFDSF